MPPSFALSAPEALVLLSLPDFDGKKAVKLGMLQLLMQGVLRLDVEQRPGFLSMRKFVRLRVVKNSAMLPPAPASLIDVVSTARKNGLMAEVVKQAKRRYGNRLAGFVRDFVTPQLVRHGLVERRRVRLLGLLPVTRFYRTAAGEAEKTRITRTTNEALAIPRFLDSDPAEAVALAAAAGSAILLVDALQPHYRRLSEAMRKTDDGGGDGGGATVDLSSWPRGDDSDDTAGFDFAAFDLSGFDDFDAGFEAFDSGFDSAADGGGDGGGGDGGGSGC